MSSGSRTTIALMLLAGDVGGTKTLMGLFTRAQPRPVPAYTESFRTLDFPDLAALSLAFVRHANVHLGALTGACFVNSLLSSIFRTR